MRKTAALILILSALSYGGINDTMKATVNGKWSNTGNWSGGALPTILDTAYSAAVNDTVDANFRVYRYIKPAVAGTHWAIGRSDTVENLFSFSGTGTNHFGSRLVLNGSGKMLFAAGMGANTGDITALEFNGAADTLTDNMGFENGPVIINAGASLLINGSSANTWISSWGAGALRLPLTIGNNSSLTIAKTTKWYAWASGQFPILGTGARCSTTTNIMVFNNGVLNQMDTVTNFNLLYSNTPTLWFYGGQVTNNNWIFSGTNKFYNLTMTMEDNSPKVFTFFQESALRIVNLIQIGTGSAYTGTYTINFTGNLSCGIFCSATGYNGTATQTINFLASADTCDSNFIAQSNHTYNVGTSRWVFSTAKKTSLTTAAKNPLFYDFEISKTSAAACSLTTGALYCADSIVIKSGRLVTNGLAIACMSWRDSSTDTSTITGTKTIYRDMIRTALSRVKNNDSAVTRFDSLFNSRLYLAGNRAGRIRIVKDAAQYGLTLQDSPDTLRSLVDSVGWFNQNSQTAVCTTLTILDSAILSAPITAINSINFISTSKVRVTPACVITGGTVSHLDTVQSTSGQVTLQLTGDVYIASYCYLKNLKATGGKIYYGQTCINGSGNDTGSIVSLGTVLPATAPASEQFIRAGNLWIRQGFNTIPRWLTETRPSGSVKNQTYGWNPLTGTYGQLEVLSNGTWFYSPFISAPMTVPAAVIPVSTTATTQLTPWGFATQGQGDSLSLKVNQVSTLIDSLRAKLNVIGITQ